LCQKPDREGGQHSDMLFIQEEWQRASLDATDDRRECCPPSRSG